MLSEKGQGETEMYTNTTVQVLAPMLFISIFHLFTQPAADFWQIFIVSLGIYDACVNIAIFSSILLQDSRALTVSIVSICICNVLSGFNPTLTQLKESLGNIPIPINT